MNIELIFVGTEILLGNISNTNAQFLAGQCAALGFSCTGQTVVADDADMLKNALKNSLSKADFVIIAGGMGPTKDDITKETVSDYLGLELEFNEEINRNTVNFFKNRKKEVPSNCAKLSYIPKGSSYIYNRGGVTPGVIIEKEGKNIILLPGRPEELMPIYKENASEYLKSKSPKVIISQTVKICGLSESEVADRISDLYSASSNPSITTCAKIGEVHLRITASANDEKSANKLIKPIVREVKTRFGFDIYTSEDDVALEDALCELLLANKLTISTFESCTGGLVAGRLINVPGVSEAFKHGHITYSNSAKQRFLGVHKKVLDEHTAVSYEVCEEMVKGAMKFTKSDVVIAVTGLAGPDGGTEEKPIGLVYIGCGVKGNITVNEYHFHGDRMKIRESAVAASLTLARKCVLEYISRTTFTNFVSSDYGKGKKEN